MIRFLIAAALVVAPMGVQARALLTSPLTLYVDPVNGNDTNPCVSAGTGACKTFQGCYNNIVVGYDLSAMNTDFIGSIAGTVLTVTSVRSGVIQVGQTILAQGATPASRGVGLLGGTAIASFGTGTGGVGTYNLTTSQTFPTNEFFAVAVTCLSAPGQSYTDGGIITYQSVVGQAQAASVLMDGNGSTFTDTVGNFTGIFNIGNYAAAEIAVAPRFGVRRMTLQSSTTETVGLEASGGVISVLDGMTFGAMPGGFHMLAEGAGSQIVAIYTAYTITGGAVAHVAATVNGNIVVQNDAITIVGNPHFQNSYALVQANSQIWAGASIWAGTATGPIFYIATGGTIDGTGNSQALPGNTPGQCLGGFLNGVWC